MIEQTYPAEKDVQIIEVKPDAADWQHILQITRQPQRVFICQQDPLMMVDAVVQQLSQTELEIFVNELVYRTKLFF